MPLMPAAQVYGPLVPTEIAVQICLRDFLQPGDSVLDLGANIGGVSVALSRAVGPSGRIHAFEANPDALASLRENLAVNGASNVTVVPRAVWSSTGPPIEFYLDDSDWAQSSSLVWDIPGRRSIHVETVTIDDYCKQCNLAPKAIKMDVEGAEYQVLQGAGRLLKESAPVIVLEYGAYRPEAEDPVEYLRSHGYALFDINMYRQVTRSFYLSHFATPPQGNVLAIPKDRLKASGYDRLKLRAVATSDFPAGTTSSGAIQLPQAGRYQVILTMSGPPAANAVLCVVNSAGERLECRAGPLAALQEPQASYAIVEIDRPSNIVCHVAGRGGEQIALDRVQVRRIERSTTVLRKLFGACLPSGDRLTRKMKRLFSPQGVGPS
jgi:FkbM family methyltransferase